VVFTQGEGLKQELMSAGISQIRILAVTSPCTWSNQQSDPADPHIHWKSGESIL
jgi:hypothetical protein